MVGGVVVCFCVFVCCFPCPVTVMLLLVQSVTLVVCSGDWLGFCVVDAVSVALHHELVSLRLLAAVSSHVPPATTRLAVCACARALNSAVVVVSAVGVSTNMSLVIPLADNKSFTIPLADLPESCHEIITLLVDEQCPLSVYLTAIVCAVSFFFYDTFVSTLLCMWVCIVRVCASLCVCVCVLCLFLCSCVRVCVCACVWVCVCIHC